MENVYLGRQPIVDINSNICAYEILYRDENREAKIDGHRHASASVINSVLNVFGTRTLLGNYRAFIKVDEKFLMHDLIFTVPTEFFVFSLLNSVPMNERVIERVQQLHEKGYKLCRDDVVLSEIKKYAPIYKELSYIKVSFANATPPRAKEFIKALKERGITSIAAKIETTQEYNTVKELGYGCFEGYFFAKPKIVENAKYEPSQAHILKLYNLLMQDVNIDEITKEFENNHELTVKLLQFINSGAFHFRKRLSSIHHILVLVGRVPLAQWLMLMIYSKSVSKGNSTSPLMLMVKNRTHLMENILKAIDPNVRSNMLGEAYFVGVLSLMDTLFGVQLERILDDMHVSDDVKSAILYDYGTLGEIFALVRGIEEFDTNAIRQFEERYELHSNIIKEIVLQSIKEVNSFENPELQSA